MMEADSFDHRNIFRVPSTINKISDVEINKVSHGHWNNTRNDDNKNWGKYTQKKQYYKGKKDFDRKPWQNKDQKPWNKDHKKQYGNKESKDACITVTKDAKYFCPTCFDEGIFNAVTKLLHEKVEQVKRSGSDSAKTVNAIEHGNFCNFFKIPEQLCDIAFTQVVSEATPKNSGEEAD